MVHVSGFSRILQIRPTMRLVASLSLLALVFASATSALAQGMVVAVPCPGACGAAGEPPERIQIDSVDVWADLRGDTATTYVSHVIRNPTGAAVEGAFFFPLPRGASVQRVVVSENGRAVLYNEWSAPAQSRRILRQLLHGQPSSQAGSFRDAQVVHVRIPAIPPGATRRLQIGYSQPLRARAGSLVYQYPLAGAATAPAGELSLGVTVTTRAGFTELHSPSHAVDVRWGSEMGRCPPGARCGFTGVPSRRQKVVRMEHTPDARTHDFVLVYTPSAGEGARPTDPWQPDPPH